MLIAQKILKLLLMIAVAPIVVALTLFVWICLGLVYVSADLTRNQQFTLQWHDLLHAMEERLTGEDEGKQQEENLLLLRLFYLLPYKGTTDFYSQFMERMEYWNEQIR